MRKFFNRELKAEPRPKPDNPEVYEVEAEGVTLDARRDILDRAIRGSSVTLLVPDLPWLKKKRRKGR